MLDTAHARSETSPGDVTRARPVDPSRANREMAPRLSFSDDDMIDPIPVPEGEVTLVEGARGTEPMRHRLVVEQARAGQATMHVHGGDRLDTTGLARRAQADNLDPGYVLRSSIVARAFTAYQLSVLVEERLPQALARVDRLSVALVVDPLRLYTDEDVRRAEAKRLASGAFDEIATTAETNKLPVVLVQPPRAERPELLAQARELATKHVLVQAQGEGSVQSGQRRPELVVTLPGEDQRHRVQDPRRRQARLNRFTSGGTA